MIRLAKRESRETASANGKTEVEVFGGQGKASGLGDDMKGGVTTWGLSSRKLGGGGASRRVSETRSSTLASSFPVSMVESVLNISSDKGSYQNRLEDEELVRVYAGLPWRPVLYIPLPSPEEYASTTRVLLHYLGARNRHACTKVLEPSVGCTLSPNDENMIQINTGTHDPYAASAGRGGPPTRSSSLSESNSTIPFLPPFNTLPKTAFSCLSRSSSLLSSRSTSFC